MKAPTFAAADTVRASGMGVSLDCPTRCQMCAVSEHQTFLVKQELSEAHGSTILAMQDREIAMGMMRDADKRAAMWRDRFWMAFLAFGLTVAFAVYQGGNQ